MHRSTGAPRLARRVRLQESEQLAIDQLRLFQMTEMTGAHDPVKLHSAGEIGFIRSQIQPSAKPSANQKNSVVARLAAAYCEAK